MEIEETRAKEMQEQNKDNKDSDKKKYEKPEFKHHNPLESVSTTYYYYYYT